MELPSFARACLALLLPVLFASGCSTMRGAPKPLVTRSQINGSEIVDAEAEIRTLAAPGTPATRNASLLKLMSLADLRYQQYRLDLINNRRSARAGAGGVNLLADVAATLTTSVGVKDNYIALSALINGGEAVFDREYLFDKTVDALIVRMDADRKAKQAEIYGHLGQDLEQYPGHSALADVLEYFGSGTLDSALVSVNRTVQTAAAADRAESERVLASLQSPQAAANAEGTDRMWRFVGSLNDANLAKLRGFLGAQKVPVEAAPGGDAERRALRRALTVFRTDRMEAGKSDADVVAELKAAGFVVPD